MAYFPLPPSPNLPDTIDPLAVIHVPEWFPGARYKRAARKWYRIVDSALQAPYDKVKRELVSFLQMPRRSSDPSLSVCFIQASGTAAPSVTAHLLSKLDENSSDLEVMASKMVPGAMYIAGADTVSKLMRRGWQLGVYLSQTVTALESFILAMTMYPQVQRKAQAEIDHVIGNSRLPVHSDEDSLPYLQAVLKELLRWHPVTPLSMSSSSSHLP
jgi:hypothetical protein